MRVHVEALAAQEADEGEPRRLGEIHREARGRRHGGHESDAGESRLLGDLEAEPSRNEEDRRTWALAPQNGADGLVRRVVTSDVLSCENEAPVCLEEARRVKAARGREHTL